MNRVCILIATYNEASSISNILQRLSNYDIVIVDDSSPDGTANICKTFNNVEVLSRPPKSGIASAYTDGFKYILKKNKYDIIVQMDAGNTHNPDNIPEMVKLLQENNSDLVIGSRRINKQKITSYRTLLSKAAIILMNIINVKQSDVTSGFRVWRVDLLNKICWEFINARGFAFQLQMLFNASYLNAKISEFYIEYKLTNSTLNRNIVFEAINIWFDLFFNQLEYELQLRNHIKNIDPKLFKSLRL